MNSLNLIQRFKSRHRLTSIIKRTSTVLLFVDDFTPPPAFRSPSSANLYVVLAAPPAASPSADLLLLFYCLIRYPPLCLVPCRVQYPPLCIIHVHRCCVRQHLLASMAGINYLSCFVRRRFRASLPSGGECLTSARQLSNFYRRQSRCLLVVVFLENAVLDLFLFCSVLGNRLDFLCLLVRVREISMSVYLLHFILQHMTESRENCHGNSLN
jgi:hypothetical protein